MTRAGGLSARDGTAADSGIEDTAGGSSAPLLSRLVQRWRNRPAPAVDGGELGRPLDPLTVRQWLWGPGFVIPGGPEHVLDLVRSLRLDSTTTLLDAAAGLGGPARTIAESLRTCVAGLERDPDLARQGMELSLAQGLARRAAVARIDPEDFELDGTAYDSVLAREATHAVQDKERFLRILILGLRPGGRLLLTDFLLDREAGEQTELSAWAARQPYPPHLWTFDQYADCLTSLGFELEESEDLTAGYRQMVLAGWQRLLRRLDRERRRSRDDLLVVLDEAERWAGTIRALDGGALRFHRISAVARRVPVDRG